MQGKELRVLSKRVLAQFTNKELVVLDLQLFCHCWLSTIVHCTVEEFCLFEAEERQDMLERYQHVKDLHREIATEDFSRHNVYPFVRELVG